MKLTPEQVKQLVDYRQKYLDDSFKLTPVEITTKAVERRKATDAAFAAALKPEQLRRLREIALQHISVARTGRISPTMLESFPELADALKLTDAQKRPASTNPDRGPFATIITLTPEQMKTLDAMHGEPFKTPLTASRDPRVQPPTLPMPTDLQYLEAQAVQTEIKLTDEQVKTIAALAKKWTDGTAELRALSIEQRQLRSDTFIKETAQAVAAAVRPEQLTRVRQLALQQLIHANGVNGFLSAPALVEALRLNDAQQKGRDELIQAQNASFRTAFLSGAEYPVIEKQVADIEQATHDKLTKLLTPEQQKTLKEQLGEPFTGTIAFPSRFLGASPDGPANLPAAFAEVYRNYFGNYYLELGYLTQKPLQDELKLSEAQTKKAEDAWKRWRDKFAEGTAAARRAKLPEMSKMTEKELADILTPEQQARFRQIVLQTRAKPSTTVRGTMSVVSRYVTAAGYPGVADELKLTMEQREKLTGGTLADQVLTPEQNKQLQSLLGEPYKGQLIAPTPPATTRGNRGGTGADGTIPNPLGGQGGRGTSLTATLPLITLAKRANIASALMVTPDQLEKLDAFEKRRIAAVLTAAQAADPIKAIAAVHEMTGKELQAILNAGQYGRLKQLELQTQALAGPATLLRSTDIASSIGLTDEQSNRVAAIQADASKTQTLLRAKLPNEQDVSVKLRDLTNEKYFKTLTEAQRKQWQALLGEPFPGLTPIFPRLGGN